MSEPVLSVVTMGIVTLSSNGSHWTPPGCFCADYAGRWAQVSSCQVWNASERMIR